MSVEECWRKAIIHHSIYLQFKTINRLEQVDELIEEMNEWINE